MKKTPKTKSKRVATTVKPIASVKGKKVKGLSGKKGKTKVVKSTAKKKGKALKGDPTLRAVEGQQLTERQIKAFVAQYNERGNFPAHKIVCTVTGKLSTAVGPWLRKQVAKFGSAENLLRNYKCRNATKKVKPVKVKKVRRFSRKHKDTNEDENKRYDIPTYNPNPIKVILGGERLIEDTRTACQRPDIYIHNGRNCGGCGFYEICENSLKCLPKWMKYEDGEFVSKK